MLDLVTVPKRECIPPKRPSFPKGRIRRQHLGLGVKSSRKSGVYAGDNAKEYTQEALCLANGVGRKTGGIEVSKSSRRK